MTIRASFQRGQKRRRATQKKRSAARILGRGRLAVRTASCWRRARFSISRLDRDAARRRSQASMKSIRGNIATGWRAAGAGSTTPPAWIRGSIRGVQSFHCQRGWGFGEGQARVGVNARMPNKVTSRGEVLAALSLPPPEPRQLRDEPATQLPSVGGRSQRERTGTAAAARRLSAHGRGFYSRLLHHRVFAGDLFPRPRALRGEPIPSTANTR